jgi:HTH-type transcriptional regulator / antitoxin HigA
MSNAIAKKKTADRHPSDSYLRLIREFPLRPIRNDADYDAAEKMLHRLVLRDEKSLDAGEEDYLETLEMLFDAYDNEHGVIEKLETTPLQRLKFLIEQNKLAGVDLGRIIGSQPLASMVLSGKRELSKAAIYKLAKHFKLEPGYFL